jgi:endo-1,4-beta-D-glucanase Y
MSLKTALLHTASFIRHFRYAVLFAAVVIALVVLTLRDDSEVAGAAYAFPYNSPTGISFNSADLRQSWTDWKAGHITSNNAGAAPRHRVMGGTSISDTVSEGQAYGMLFASIFDEQALFDGLWLFAADHLNSNGLMHWKIGGYRQVTGTGAATDADVDMAMALVNACMKVRQGTWTASTNGLDYCALARTLIGKIWQTEVDHPGAAPSGGLSNNVGYELLPGDSWNLRSEYPEGITNLSYFAPGYFRVFAAFTGNTGWNEVIDRGYEIVNLAQSKPGNCSRLVSNWNQYDGDPQVVSWQGNTSNYFGWDGARFAWRVAVDRHWYNSAESRETMNEVGGFFASIGASNILTEYQLNGSQVQNYRTAFFVANGASAIWAAPSPAAINCGQATASIKSSKQDAYNSTVSTREAGTGNNSTYYNHAWRLLSMLLMTGNFPNLYTTDPGNPAATPTPTRTATVMVTQNPATATKTPVSSPVPVTPTSTVVVSPVPTTSTGSGLKVQYRVPDTAVGDNMIRAHVQIINSGGAGVPLGEVALRYYFTKEAGGGLSFNCDWAVVGCANLSGSFLSLPTLVNGADTVLEIRFTAAAGMLQPGKSTGEIQIRLNKNDWTSFNQANDYSYSANHKTFADWNKIVLIRSNAVVWGIAPGGTSTPPTSTPLPNNPTATPVLPQATATMVPPTSTATSTAMPTNPPTLAPTLTPTVKPPTGTASLRVQYRVPDASPSDNMIRAHFQLINGGTAGVPLSEVALRYYFTKEAGSAPVFNCDWAAVGCGNLRGTFVSLQTPINGADTYLEIRFTAGAGMVMPGGSTGEMQVRVNKGDWSPFNEANDYSYSANHKTFADWNRVVLLRGSTVIWGAAPR